MGKTDAQLLNNAPKQATSVEVPDDASYDVIKSIDEMCCAMLSKDYHMILPYQFQATTITYAYLKCIFKYLHQQMSESRDTTTTRVNFMDLLEFAADYRRNPDAEKEGNLNLMVSAGYNAKLRIKSDALTEDN